MGTMKKYIAAYSFESVQLITGTDTDIATCIPFKTVEGNDITQTYYNWSSNYGASVVAQMNNENLRNLVPVATADILTNYTLKDYTATEVVGNSFTTSRTIVNDSCRLTYTITLTNSGETEAQVKCIKFIKPFITAYNRSNNTRTYQNALCYGYFLDNPITLGAGESATVSILMEIEAT